ncbi:hypothetical protein PMKS-003130 [Pichia membranifaciens]|uniref:PCI domain-containing protein n=1 Tax=Pichia membranifaciens TaxID=4926 RepID=A0A1Q2YJA9_9ASCO|nr:hypothetical protein PMKS-003130 [Pichia membranifaciens]
MSDWEEDMYDDDEEEELSFEEDEDIDETKEGLIEKAKRFDEESLYFQAKNLKEENNAIDAAKVFEIILSNQNATSTYVFKSLKQLVKIYESEKELGKILEALDKLFGMKDDPNLNNLYFNSSLFKIVNRIDRENYEISFAKSIFLKFQHYVSLLSPQQQDETSNKKLKIKVQLCIANCYLNARDLDQVSEILSALENEIINANDSIKSTYHLDILAAQILLLLSKQANMLELKRLTETANNLISGIPQSKILGAINEGSGLVSMYSGDFKAANSFFQVAFKSFNDCGDKRRVNVLVKFILSSMLSQSEVDPFQSSDFQGFIKIRSIENLMDIYGAFQNMDIDRFNVIVNRKGLISNVGDYQIINDFMPELKELFYTNYITEHIPVFERVKFSYFTGKLGLTDLSFEQLLIKIYNKGLISNYKIDCVNNIIIKSSSDKFTEINPLQYLENAFKYYTLPNTNIAEEFETKYRQLGHDGNDSEKMKMLKDFPEMMDLDYEDAERLKYFDDSNHAKGNTSNNIIDNKSIERGFPPLNKNCIPANVDKLKFETCYSVASLQKIAFLLFSDHFIKKDLTNDSQIGMKLRQCIEKYIELMRNTIPSAITKNVSYFDKVKDEKMQLEFSKLFSDTTLQENGNDNAQNDQNIPDVIQTTLMNPIEPPPNPDVLNDGDSLLKGKEKKILRLKTIEESVKMIVSKHNELKIRGCNFSTRIEDYDEDSGRLKKHDSEMNRIVISRLFNRQPISADQSETTSLDNMSFDGVEDREDVF